MNTKSIKEFFRPTKVKVVLLIFLMVYIFVDYNLSNCHIGDVFKVTISCRAESFKKISYCTNP